MLESTFRAGLAQEVLGDVEPGCRLRWREQILVVVFTLGRSGTVADHRLTKIFVFA